MGELAVELELTETDPKGSYRGPPVAAHDQSREITKRHSSVRFKGPIKTLFEGLLKAPLVSDRGRPVKRLMKTLFRGLKKHILKSF